MSVTINHYKKSHTGFQLKPTRVTLNGLERRNSSYFALFLPNSIALDVVEARPIMRAKYPLPLLAKTFQRYSRISL